MTRPGYETSGRKAFCVDFGCSFQLSGNVRKDIIASAGGCVNGWLSSDIDALMPCACGLNGLIFTLASHC